VYNGHVEADGETSVRLLDELIITKFSVGGLDNNVYLLSDRATGDSVLIDAACAPERILDVLDHSHIVGIVTTHAHPDHWRGLAEVAEATGAPTLAHEVDAPSIGHPTDHVLQDGDVVTFGESRLTVRNIRGHTDGSIILIYDDPGGHPHIFTGDCLFPGGVGKTYSADSFGTLLTGVIEGVFDVFPDETWIYPGHGDDTTLGAERPHLEEWAQRGW